MKKFLIFLIIIPNLLFAENNARAKDIVNNYQSSKELKLYALGIVEGLIHADEANFVLTGKNNICYTSGLSLDDFLRVIDAHYLKNKDLWKNTRYVFLANMALQVAFPCND
jgi:hypothetical protein